MKANKLHLDSDCNHIPKKYKHPMREKARGEDAAGGEGEAITVIAAAKQQRR
jgi:hypothetical protein